MKMITTIVNAFVEWQIQNQLIIDEDRALYVYGYKMLIEYALNIIAAVCIAVLFRAYLLVAVFTISFMLLRKYAGGYHAQSGLSCILLSTGMQIAVIIVVRFFCSITFCNWIYVSEVIMIPCLFPRLPIPVKNRVLSDREKKVFGKRAKIVYCAEILIGIYLQHGYVESSLAIWISHFILFCMGVVRTIRK